MELLISGNAIKEKEETMKEDSKEKVYVGNRGKDTVFSNKLIKADWDGFWMESYQEETSRVGDSL